MGFLAERRKKFDAQVLAAVEAIPGGADQYVIAGKVGEIRRASSPDGKGKRPFDSNLGVSLYRLEKEGLVSSKDIGKHYMIPTEDGKGVFPSEATIVIWSRNSEVTAKGQK